VAVPPLLSTASAFHSTLSGSSGTSTMRARYRHAWEASCAVAQQAAPSECAGTHSIQSYAASRSRCHAYPSTLQTHRKDDRVTCRRPHNSPPRVPLAWRGAPPPPHACPFALCRYAASAPTALARAAPGAQAEPRRVSPPLPRCGACCPLHRPAAPSSDSSACQRSAAAPVALLFEQGNSKEASRSTPRPLPSLTSRSCGLTAPRRRWPGRAARTRCGTARAHARRPAARGGPAAPDRALQRVLATAGECCAASPRVRPRGSEAGALRRLRQLAVVRLLHLLPQVDQDGLHRLLARPVPQRVKVARVHLRGAPQHHLYCRVVGPLVSHRRGQEQARLRQQVHAVSLCFAPSCWSSARQGTWVNGTQSAKLQSRAGITVPSAATQLMLTRVWNLTLGAWQCAAPQRQQRTAHTP